MGEQCDESGFSFLFYSNQFAAKNYIINCIM
jgi:hypothetical protein